MCGHCGCENTTAVSVLNLQTGAHSVLEHGAPDSIPHHHEHQHDHVGRHGHAQTHAHRHGHQHEHSHQHAHDDTSHVGHGLVNGHPDHRRLDTSVVELEARVLAKNDALAVNNRAWFAEWDILTLNLVSSPGAGKTTLLERTPRWSMERPTRFLIITSTNMAM